MTHKQKKNGRKKTKGSVIADYYWVRERDTYSNFSGLSGAFKSLSILFTITRPSFYAGFRRR